VYFGFGRARFSFSDLDALKIINKISGFVDDGCLLFTNSSSGITYTPVTILTGVCTNYASDHSLTPMSTSSCTSTPTADYSCSSYSYGSSLTCDYEGTCPYSYSQKFHSQCDVGSSIPTYAREWNGVSSSCTYSPLTQVGSTACSSSMSTLQHYDCSDPAHPMTTIQFLNNMNVDPVKFVTSSLIPFMNFTFSSTSINLADASTFANSVFNYTSADFYFYFSDDYINNPQNYNVTAYCSLVTITSPARMPWSPVPSSCSWAPLPSSSFESDWDLERRRKKEEEFLLYFPLFVTFSSPTTATASVVQVKTAISQLDSP